MRICKPPERAGQHSMKPGQANHKYELRHEPRRREPMAKQGKRDAESAHVSSIALVVTDPLHCLTKPTKAWRSFAPPICVKAPMRMDSASNPAPKVIAAATWNAFSQR